MWNGKREQRLLAAPGLAGAETGWEQLRLESSSLNGNVVTSDGDQGYSFLRKEASELYLH